MSKRVRVDVQAWVDAGLFVVCVVLIFMVTQ